MRKIFNRNDSFYKTVLFFIFSFLFLLKVVLVFIIIIIIIIIMIIMIELVSGMNRNQKECLRMKTVSYYGISPYNVTEWLRHDD